MREHCSFCLIADGRGVAAVVHEDPLVLAFMDSRPVRPGHVLVIPRSHVSDLFSCPSPEYSHILGVAQSLARALQRAFQPKRVGMVVAGFDVPHAHVHLIPMLEYHDITSRALLEGTLGAVALENLEVHAAVLRDELVRADVGTA